WLYWLRWRQRLLRPRFRSVSISVRTTATTTFRRFALTDTTPIILLVVLRMVTGRRNILSTACSLAPGRGIASTTCTLCSTAAGTDLDMSTIPATGTSIGSVTTTGTMTTTGTARSATTIMDGMGANVTITMIMMMTTTKAAAGANASGISAVHKRDSV